MKRPFITALMTLSLVGLMVLPSFAQNMMLPNNASSLVMTHDEFQKWYLSQPAIQKGVVEDGIKPVSLSGASASVKTLSGHVESFSYILGAGDEVSIQVFGKPELSQNDITLSNNGILTLPFVGEFQASGKSIRQLTEELSEYYKEYLVEPHITILLKKARPQITYVMGAVESPGPYLQVSKEANLENAKDVILQADFRLTTALANAGGVLDDADLRHVKIYNEHLGYLKEIDLFKFIVLGQVDQDIILKPNDVVYVPRLASGVQTDINTLKLVASSNIGKHDFAIRIYGLVRNPNVYYLKPKEMTLQTALAKAGGFTPTASPKKVLIARAQPDGTLAKLEIDSTTSDMQLYPNDVILCSETNGFAKLNTIMTAINRIISPVVSSSFFFRNMDSVWPMPGSVRDNN